jgi:hypothetical protein
MENKKEKVMHYFASDGSYGDAEKLIIVDTSEWTEEDWQEIDMAGDSDRAVVAYAIAKSKGKPAINVNSEQNEG